MSWFWILFGNKAGELIFAAVFECTMSLILLFATKRARSLNRSMIWILAGWAVWHLLNALLPMLGIKTIGYDMGGAMLHFYSTMRLGGGFYTIWLLIKAVSSLAGITLYLFVVLRRGQGKTDCLTDETSVECGTVIRVLRAIGWTIAAQLIMAVVAIPILFFFDMEILAWWDWLWTSSIYEKMAGKLLFIAGFECIISLILLFSTRRARSLNRSMIWVLAGWAVWHLLNAPLSMMGMNPGACGPFFFYNQEILIKLSRLSTWFFAALLLVKTVGSIAGIALYLLWERRWNRGKLARISDEAPVEVTRNSCAK